MWLFALFGIADFIEWFVIEKVLENDDEECDVRKSCENCAIKRHRRDDIYVCRKINLKDMRKDELDMYVCDEWKPDAQTKEEEKVNFRLVDDYVEEEEEGCDH